MLKALAAAEKLPVIVTRNCPRPERDVRLRKGQSTPRSVLRLRRPLAWFRSGGPRAGSGCRLWRMGGPWGSCAYVRGSDRV